MSHGGRPSRFRAALAMRLDWVRKKMAELDAGHRQRPYLRDEADALEYVLRGGRIAPSAESDPRTG